MQSNTKACSLQYKSSSTRQKYAPLITPASAEAAYLRTVLRPDADRLALCMWYVGFSEGAALSELRTLTIVAATKAGCKTLIASDDDKPGCTAVCRDLAQTMLYDAAFDLERKYEEIADWITAACLEAIEAKKPVAEIKLTAAKIWKAAKPELPMMLLGDAITAAFAVNDTRDARIQAYHREVEGADRRAVH